MTHRRMLLWAIVSVVVLGGVFTITATTRAQGSVPPADRLRFRVVTQEPIANADLRGTVPGWSVIVVKDTKTDQCYATFLSTTQMSKTDATACP